MGGTLSDWFCGYGYSGGHTNTRRARGTSRLVWSVIDELSCHPKGPSFLAIDLNADEDIPAIKYLLEELHWIDVGAHASTWGRPDKVPTCLTANSLEPTRRDYLFASPEGWARIKDFRVITGDQTPVHATLQVQLDLSDQPCAYFDTRRPKCLMDLIGKGITNLFGEPPKPLSDDQLLEEDATDEQGRPEVPTDFLERQAKMAQRVLADRYSNNERLYWVLLHEHMDRGLDLVKYQLAQFIADGNLDAFWKLWWRIVENSIVNFVGPIEGIVAKDYAGRGVPMVRKCFKERSYRTHDGYISDPMGPPWMSQLLTQSNRCSHLANCIAAQLRGHATGTRLQGLLQDISSTTSVVRQFLAKEEGEGDFLFQRSWTCRGSGGYT